MKNTSDRLHQNIHRLVDELHHISNSHLAERPKPRKWSKKEILGHLIDSAVNNWKRFTDIPLCKGQYQYLPYAQAELVTANNYQETTVAELVILWQAMNRQIAKVIDKVSAEERKITINIDGDIKTLDWLMEDYVDHLEYHLAQILAPAPAPAIQKLPLRVTDAIQKLGKVPTEFVALFSHGDLEIEYYQPNKIDRQQPHSRDEVYVIARGKGEFVLEGKTCAVVENEVLFVKAGKEHRFVNFSADFATWVIFYGLER